MKLQLRGCASASAREILRIWLPLTRPLNSLRIFWPGSPGQNNRTMSPSPIGLPASWGFRKPMMQRGAPENPRKTSARMVSQDSQIALVS